MKTLFGRSLSPDAEVRRIRQLYWRLPSSAAAALLGIFLCFLVLFDSVPTDLLKAWCVYMVSVIAARIWIWYMFSKTYQAPERIRRWEWLFAAGALFTGLGWGALFGPLHPPAAHPEARIMIVLLVVVVSFAGAVFLALSQPSFWLFVAAALGPALIHYVTVLGRQLQWPIAAAACCLAVLVLLQRTLYRSETSNLERGMEAEGLLAEQHAIFDSSPMGIATVTDGRIVKCNMRLAELLGKRIVDLTGALIQNLFQCADEAAHFMADSEAAFARGRVVQGMYRLRRGDNTQFWAELSGRRMAGSGGLSVWMIADVTLRVANERRARPRNQPQEAAAGVAPPSAIS